MNNKSLKINYIFNTILVMSNFLFPIITLPYINRVLGAENVGKINFALAFTAYFIMIINIGIPVYGIREIAKVRNEQDKMDKVFSELLIINIITSLIGLLVYIPLVFILDKTKPEYSLYLITGVSIIFNAVAIEWFYSGIEEYKYIAKRSIFFKIVAMVLLFMLVKNQSDYLVYAGIGVFSAFASNILNIINSRKYVKFTTVGLNIKRHIKPNLILVIGVIIGSIYLNGDTILLGMITDSNKSVAYYSTDRKLMAIVIAFTTSLGTILVPRLSFLIGNNQEKQFNDLAEKAVRFIYFISFPVIVYTITMADKILFFLGGEEFTKASYSLMIISPMILFTSLAVFAGNQVLIPLGKEKKIVTANFAGAIVNLGLNLMFIKQYSFYSTCVAIVISEMVVFAVQYIYIKRQIRFKFFSIDDLYYVLAAITGGILIIMTNKFFENIIFGILITMCEMILIYGILLFIKKDYFLRIILNKLKMNEKQGV